MTDRAIHPACLIGQHQARRVRLGDQAGDAHTTCRRCGCQLRRTAATRRWFLSGTLGHA